MTAPNTAPHDDHPDDRLASYVRDASRSPSAHNTQPWSPRVVGDAIELAVVPGRTLPAGDPTFRDLLLGLGAWVESVAISAAQDGRSVTVEPLPALAELEDLPARGPADPSRPLARLRFADSRSTDGRSIDGTERTPFTPAHVRDRRVFRGTLLPAPDIWTTAPALPASLRLLEVDAPAMTHLTRLGLAFTVSRPAVAEELVHWVRLSPEHPRYRLDGMTDAMLGLPGPVARVAAPFTRRPRLRDAALTVGGVVGRTLEGLGRDQPLPRRAESVVDDRVRHLVLVADPGAGRTSATEAADSRIGVSEVAALEAGRALQRLWLHAHTHGVVVAPHSEVIDSPLAHGALRRRLGLRRSEVALAVFSAGRAGAAVPRSPRLTDDSR